MGCALHYGFFDNGSNCDHKCDHDCVFFSFSDKQTVSYKIGVSSLNLSRGSNPLRGAFFQV